MPPPNCPTQKQLETYVAGLLAEPTADVVEKHVSECALCPSTLNAIEQETQDFVGILRAAGKKDRPACLDEPEYASAVQAIAGIVLTTEKRSKPTKVSIAPLAASDEATVIGNLQNDDDATVDSPGTRFGQYELIGEVARGGMGVVYRARQISADRIVALKVVRRVNPDPVEIERFLTEARAAARLDHPHIVPVYEVGEHDGQPFFSMKLINGRSLSDVLRDGPLDVTRAAKIVRTAAAAIQHAHEFGIIHRDIKPGNILLDERDEPHVMDFGLARLTDQSSELTGDGQVMGTPSYMPPEQAQGLSDKINSRSDVYSLGAALYACLTGRPPFQGASSMATVMQVVQQDVVPPRQLNSQVTRDLEIICVKCLEKDQTARYATAAEVADDLQRYLDLKPIAARPAGQIERFAKWIRRYPLKAALLATGVLATVAIAMAFTGSLYQAELEESLEQTQAAKRTTELREQETAQALTIAEAANLRAERAEYFRLVALTTNALDSGDFRSANEFFDRLNRRTVSIGAGAPQ